MNVLTLPIIILLGGKGERFYSQSNSPKQLVKVTKNVLLIDIILQYKRSGINYFILPLGNKSDFFINFFKNKGNIKKYNLNIIKSYKEIKPEKINIQIFKAGTKTSKLNRIIKSLKKIRNYKGYFGVCYGDIFANINFKKYFKFFSSKSKKAILTSYKEKSPYGHLIINKNFVKNFIEKPYLEKPINIGFYFFDYINFIQINKKFSSKTVELEDNILPYYAKNNKLISVLHKGYHFTINNNKDLEELRKTKKN